MFRRTVVPRRLAKSCTRIRSLVPRASRWLCSTSNMPCHLAALNASTNKKIAATNENIAANAAQIKENAIIEVTSPWKTSTRRCTTWARKPRRDPPSSDTEQATAMDAKARAMVSTEIRKQTAEATSNSVPGCPQPDGQGSPACRHYACSG